MQVREKGGCWPAYLARRHSLHYAIILLDRCYQVFFSLENGPPLLDIEKVYSQEHTHVLVCWDSLKTMYMYLLMLSY